VGISWGPCNSAAVRLPRVGRFQGFGAAWGCVKAAPIRPIKDALRNIKPSGPTVIAMLSESNAGAKSRKEDAAILAEEHPAPQPRKRGPIRPAPTVVQIILLVPVVIAFLYWARGVVLPVVLAFMAAAALKPVMRLLAQIHIPTVPSALIVLLVMVATLIIGFIQAGRPAMNWIDQAPEHVAELRNKVARLYPGAARTIRALTAISAISVTDDGKEGTKKTQTVEIKDNRQGNSLISMGETFLGGLCEIIVIVYLLLASGDMFLRKLVRVIPVHSEKKRAIDISHEVQAQVSNYLFSVSLINIVLGLITGAGFLLMGVPRAGMWGFVVAILNFIPYFGPVVGVTIMLVVGLLSFDDVSQAIMPFGWYLLLHLIEANFVSPLVLGRRFTLNPVAIFISLMFWYWLWGVPGALLSVPILVSVKTVCCRLPRANFVAEFISR
jgi:predicted PurR-regulated permease PerM